MERALVRRIRMTGRVKGILVVAGLLVVIHPLPLGMLVPGMKMVQLTTGDVLQLPQIAMGTTCATAGG